MNGEDRNKILDLNLFFFRAINVPLGKSHVMKKKYEEFVEDFHIIIHKKIKIYHINK
jgi:hypothetical protein